MPKPSPKRQGEFGFSLLLIVFSVSAFWQSYAISGFTGLTTAGVFPMLASATMVVAAVCILVQNLSHPSERHSDPTHTTGFFQAILPLRIVTVVALITAYVIAMPQLGFLLSSAVFLFLAFSYLWRKSFVASLLITVISVICVYLVFRKLFQVVLPEGTLFRGWF
ncbi:MAG: tripartite tricarboxylate transporter TctB family protein [Gammaproteobacteria bacterium]|nr:tripartite tricarboxylate transporter TctB family protein [Gammaproteobacteria bacterium]